MLQARAYVNAVAFYPRNRALPHRAIAELLSADETRALRFWGEIEWRFGVAGNAPIPNWRRILVAPVIHWVRSLTNE